MAKKRPFRLQDVNTVREFGAMDVTRDGRLVALTVSEASSDGKKVISRIWLLDRDAPGGARPVTAKDKPATLPQFSADGTRLAYLAEQPSKDDEKGKMQLVVLEAPFSEPRAVTTFVGGVGYFEWLDSRRFLVLAECDASARKRKKAVEDRRDAYEVDADEPQTRMFLVGLSGGKPRPIGPVRGHVAAASASSDGKSIAYVRCRHSTLAEIWKESELHVLNVASGRSRLLRTMSSPVSATYRPQFSPDGKRIAVIDGVRTTTSW